MCSLEALAAAASPLTPTESSVCHVGTQAGAPPPRWTSKPPLKHHSSELLLSPARVRVPLVPQTLGYSYIGYSNPGFTPPVYPGGRQSPPRGAANRARRRPPPPQYPADSPTSSLDCLPIRTDNWAGQAGDNNQGKMNGSVYGMLPDVSIRLGAPPPPPCRCPWGCGAEGGSEPRAPEAQSAEGLSWRRLHMSRAKLKATATTSELLSGFAMIAMVELQINEPTNVPEWLFVMFAVCTTVLVAVHIFALMISTYLLPNIDAVSKMSASDVLRESPHERMRGFIELAWAFSTVLGLFLFLVEIAILCWVKFWDYSFKAATAATIIVIPVLIVFVAFAVHFYHSLVVQKCDASNQDMEQLESMKRNLDNVTAASISPV